jgi:hypothetical protein
MTLPTQGRRRVAWLTGLVAVTVLAISAKWVSRKEGSPVPPVPSIPEEERLTDGGRQANSDTTLSAVSSVIARARRGLEQDWADSRSHLDALRSAIRRSPPTEASAAIREFLASKADAATGQEFKLGPAGLLTNSPTLRAFLLDQLGQIDPAGAVAQARLILDSMESPDEWAVALRSCALGDASAEGRAYLAGKLESMLTFEPWLRDPSTGFLEAFDVAVHLGGTNLIPALAAVLRSKEKEAASHAAYLALDRLAIADGASTLAHLQANPDLMVGREITRANYFARADVRDGGQKQIVETYLLSPSLDPAELDKFAGLYPNANFMISHNLLTRNATPDHAWLAARDAESLRLVRQWIADPRFAHRLPQLQAIQRRLENFARQAGAP